MVKKLFLGILVTIFSLCATPYAFAKRDGFGPCLCYTSLSKEQAEKLRELREKFRADTQPLRKEISEKRAELKRMYADPKVTEDEIRMKYKELSELTEKLREKRMELKLEKRRILTPEQLSRLGQERMTRCGRGKVMGL